MDGSLYQVLQLERSSTPTEVQARSEAIVAIVHAMCLSEECSDQLGALQVKRAYKSLATRLHPDKAGGDVQAFKRLHDAYEVLSDGAKVTSTHISKRNILLHVLWGCLRMLDQPVSRF